MHKITTIIIIAILSAQFLTAQTQSSGTFVMPSGGQRELDSLRQIKLKKDLLTNEEFFEKAELIIEGKQVKHIGYYDAKGNYNPDDFYSASSILVLKVFKGDTTLVGKTICLIREGGVIYKPAFPENAFPEAIESNGPSKRLDNGLYINDIYPSILFFMKSDFPEDPNPKKVYPQLKFKLVQNRERASITFWGDGRIGGLYDLVFNNRKELYEYMKQFKGVTVPELVPMPLFQKQLEQREFQEPVFDSIQQQMIQEKWGGDDKKKTLKTLKSDNTLTLHLANGQLVYNNVQNKYYFTFDILASTNNPSIYFDGAYIRIKYDSAIFGSYVKNNGKVSLLGGNNFGNYMVFLFTDTSPDVFTVIFGANIAYQNRITLSSVPVTLLHLQMELLPGQNIVQPYPFFTDTDYTEHLNTYALTSNAGFSDYYYYDKTFYINWTNNKPVINSFSPTTINAGNQEILTITGTNFGTNPSKVRFSSADDGGKTYLKDLDDEYYVSWSNTQIKVKVPSLVFKGYGDDSIKYRGGAGTGKIQIHTVSGDSCQSADPLTIPRSYMNARLWNGGTGQYEPIQRAYLTKTDCTHDIVFTLGESIKTLPNNYLLAVTAMEAALAKWSSLLNISITLNPVCEPENIIGPDTRNMIVVNNSIPYDMKADNKFFKGWNTSGTEIYYQGKPMKISIKPNPSGGWNYSLNTAVSGKPSFYQTFLHEIGHILLLQHVNNKSDLMFWSVTKGDSIMTTPNVSCLQTAKDIVMASKNIAWQHFLTASPVTLGVTLSPLTVSISLIANEYKANPSGGFPPYTYLWGYLNTSCRSGVPIAYINNPSIPASVLNSLCFPLQVTVTDQCGNTKQATISKKSLQVSNEPSAIAIYPNPNSGSFSIAHVSGATVYIYTTTMQLAQTYENISAGANLDCGNLPAGVYVLKIVDNGEITTRKMVLIK